MEESGSDGLDELVHRESVKGGYFESVDCVCIVCPYFGFSIANFRYTVVKILNVAVRQLLVEHPYTSHHLWAPRSFLLQSHYYGSRPRFALWGFWPDSI